MPQVELIDEWNVILVVDSPTGNKTFLEWIVIKRDNDIHWKTSLSHTKFMNPRT